MYNIFHQPKKCGFFSWHDPETDSRWQEVGWKVHARIDSLEQQLNALLATGRSVPNPQQATIAKLHDEVQQLKSTEASERLKLKQEMMQVKRRYKMVVTFFIGLISSLFFLVLFNIWTVQFRVGGQYLP